MNTLKTTPEQILTLWEKNFQKLSPKHQRDFKSHSITQKLCEYELFQIQAGMELGNHPYLPELLYQVQQYGKKTRKEVEWCYESRRKRELHRAEIAEWKAKYGNIKFEPKRPKLVLNPNTAKYDKYICSSRVTHGRKDECRCRVAA
jgi:hypothetical protein